MPREKEPTVTLQITGDIDVDTLLDENDFALLVGMVLDQQIPMEIAFSGPSKILDRAGTLEPAALAAFDADAFVEVFRTPQAVNRFPGSMAGRVQAVAQAIVDDWEGDVTRIWTAGDPDGAEILRRLKKLPGFGDQKAKIFLALLGKQRGLAATGWREASAPYGDDGSFRSVADIVDPESLTKVRATKRAAKAAAKGA
jgi:uncharacterized HhH-GPD family protein